MLLVQIDSFGTVAFALVIFGLAFCFVVTVSVFLQTSEFQMVYLDIEKSEGQEQEKKPAKKGKELKVLDGKAAQNLCKAFLAQ